jgi:hypothetical protein
MMISLNAFASVGTDVLIQGKILNEFDEQKVKIVDAEGQKYFLARKLFPKDLVIKQGQAFAIEIDEKELKHIKILKK